MRAWRSMLHGRTLRHSTVDDDVRVYLARGVRAALARLDLRRQGELSKAFVRVGWQLLAHGERAEVERTWARRTWPRRRYPRQCYSRTFKYVLDHPGIAGMRLVHGVVAHAPGFIPLDHAWVELPGDIVFDAVVQAFFTRRSSYAVMSAVALDTYSAEVAERTAASVKHPGPWNARWVPTVAQLAAYGAALRSAQAAAGPSSDVGRKR